MSERGYYSDGIMPAHDVLLGIGRGKFPGVLGINHICKNTSMPNATEADITNTGIVDYVFPSDSGTVMQLASSNIADTSTSITVIGLDVDFKLKVETYALTGTTQIPIGTWTRVNRIVNSGGITFLGEVSVTDTATGLNVYSRAFTLEQVSFNPAYSPPVGTTQQFVGLIGSIIKDGGTNTNLSIIIPYREYGGAWIREFEFNLQRDGTSALEFNNLMPLAGSKPIEFLFRGVAGAAGYGCLVRSSFIISEV